MKVSVARVAYRHLRGGDVKPVAPSAEGEFFDNPQTREVRELGEVGAVTNDPEVAEEAEELPPEEIAISEVSPPTPDETLQKPGGEEFATLNRFVVETEEPVEGLPESYEEVPKHPDIKVSLRKAWWPLR